MSKEDTVTKALDDAAKVLEEENIIEEEEEVKVNPDIEEATKLGWKLEEDYEGEEHWVDAGEFLRRKPLFDAIQKSNKKSKKLQEKMDYLVEEFNKQQKAGYDRAMKDIAMAKEEAVELGDTHRYKELVQKEQTVAPVPITPIVDPEFEKFQDDNDWYDVDMQRTRYADGVGNAIKKENPNISNKDLFIQVVKEVKEAFPAKFSNPNRKKESPVTTTSTQSNKSNSKVNKTKYDLPKDARTVYDNIVKSERNPSGLSPEQFLEGYASRGGTFIERGN